MKRPPVSGDSGFTLIEAVMAIVLIGIVGVVAGMLLFQGTRSFEAMDVRDALAGEGTLAFERAMRELRLIRCTTAGNSCSPQASDITAWTATEIRFVKTDLNGVGLRLDAGNLKLRQGSGGADPEDTLAEGVTALSFEYLKRDGTAAAAVSDIWLINMTMAIAKDGETLDLRASVHPRGFR